MIDSKLFVLAETDVFLFSYCIHESRACAFELMPALLRRAKPGAMFVFLDIFKKPLELARELAEAVAAEDVTSQFEFLKLGGAKEYPFAGLLIHKCPTGVVL